ncbi:MAG: heme-binding protein [Pseudomonadales bacterium]
MTLTTALFLVTTALSLAEQQQVNISVAIVDEHGELVSFAKTDDCPFHAGVLARNKAYTSARDRQNTSSLGQWAKETGKDMGYWTDSRITGIAGGVPIRNNNKIVGAIGISGLSEEDDEALALAVLERLNSDQ